MSKVKAGFLIGILFVGLIAAAISPIILINFNNERLIGQINVSAISDDEIEGTNSNINYNTIEKLTIISNSYLDTTGTISEYLIDNFQIIVDDISILNSMENQLKTMQSYRAIPEFSLDDRRNAKISKMAYMDTSNSGKAVGLWKIKVLYDGFNVIVNMDVETSVIYNINIEVLKLDNTQLEYADEINPQKFFEYLQIKIPKAHKIPESDNAEYYSFDEYGFPFGYYCQITDRSLQYQLMSNNITNGQAS